MLLKSHMCIALLYHKHKHIVRQLIRSVYCMFIVCIILNKVANAFSNKHTNTPVLSVVDSRIHRFPGPGFPDSPIPGFPDCRIPRLPDSPIPGFSDSPISHSLF
jgi:hypothetical protein